MRNDVECGAEELTMRRILLQLRKEIERCGLSELSDSGCGAFFK